MLGSQRTRSDAFVLGVARVLPTSAPNSFALLHVRHRLQTQFTHAFGLDWQRRRQYKLLANSVTESCDAASLGIKVMPAGPVLHSLLILNVEHRSQTVTTRAIDSDGDRWHEDRFVVGARCDAPPRLIHVVAVSSVSQLVPWLQTRDGLLTEDALALYMPLFGASR